MPAKAVYQPSRYRLSRRLRGQASLLQGSVVGLELAPHVDFVEVVFADAHRHRFEAELYEAATLVQVERRLIAGGDGQLDQPQAFMVLRFIQRGLHQLLTQPALPDFAGHIHAK